MALLLPVVLLGALYFFAIRPQQQQMREHRELIASLEAGDEVVTTAGIYGTISEIEGDIVWLEVAQDLELKLAREAVQRLAIDDLDEDELDLDADEVVAMEDDEA